jgi:hypothetical protein
MNQNLDIQKKLAHYINFHNHPHSPSYNTIEGIISTFDLKPDVENVMKLLKKDYAFLQYEKDMNPNIFLRDLIDMLILGKNIFIRTKTLDLDPIIYDQFIQFREKNRFNVVLTDGSDEDLSEISLPQSAKIFLIFEGNSRAQSIYDLADHILDLRKEQN